MSSPVSSWCGTGTAVPNEEKTYWARYSDRLPSCKLVAIDPTDVARIFLTRGFLVSFFLIRDLAFVFTIHPFSSDTCERCQHTAPREARRGKGHIECGDAEQGFRKRRQLVAHRVNSRQCSTSDALGAKRTLI